MDIIYFVLIGSTLIIMKSKDESSLFGGMAFPSWHSKDSYSSDSADECSWLFKFETQGD